MNIPGTRDWSPSEWDAFYNGLKSWFIGATTKPGEEDVSPLFYPVAFPVELVVFDGGEWGIGLMGGASALHAKYTKVLKIEEADLDKWDNGDDFARDIFAIVGYKNN